MPMLDASILGAVPAPNSLRDRKQWPQHLSLDDAADTAPKFHGGNLSKPRRRRSRHPNRPVGALHARRHSVQWNPWKREILATNGRRPKPIRPRRQPLLATRAYRTFGCFPIFGRRSSANYIIAVLLSRAGTQKLGRQKRSLTGLEHVRVIRESSSHRESIQHLDPVAPSEDLIISYGWIG